MIYKLEYVEPLKIKAIEYKNTFDLINLFSDKNLKNTIYNLFANVINKQLEIDPDVNDFPLFVSHKNNLNNRCINLEYNAFIYALSLMFTDETRDIFIENHKLSGFNLKQIKRVRINFSVMFLLQEIAKILYISSFSQYRVSVKFYNPIVYSFNQNNPVQMACIFINYGRVMNILDSINDSGKLIDNINFLYAMTCDNLQLLAFGSRECKNFWSKNEARKKVLFTL